MNGAEPRGPKSTTVRLFQVDPRWYEHHWLSDPASRRRNAFAYFRRILSDCPKWWGHCREALAAVGQRRTMAANRSGLQKENLRNILLAWVFTLPACMLMGSVLFAAGLFVVLRFF